MYHNQVFIVLTPVFYTLLLFSLLSKTCSNTVSEKQAPATDEQPFASILYTAVVRGKVALPCDITPPTPDDSVALILWYKDDSLTPLYTLDSRKGYLDQARTLTSSTLDGRAYFNLHNRPAFLHIDPIRLTDAGDYRCRVDFKKARTVNTVISLKVIVPPDDPVITDVDGNDMKGLVGPFNEGDELKLLCISNGGKPRPSLTWWRDYTILDDSFEFSDKDVTSNQLTIPSLARHHLLSIFTCQAINNNITVPSATSITLDLNLKPTEVKVSQLTQVLVADKEAVLECSTFGSRPKAVIYWNFDGQRFNTPLNVGALGEHQTSTTITITPKQEHNGAEITCISENPKIPASTISDHLRLDVQYIPNLSLQLGSPTLSLQTIQEGNDIYFDCHITANPRPNKPILWRFRGVPLHPQQGVIQSNQTLVLQRVSRTQSGPYQCEASNQQGTALSNTINLKIRFAPVCASDLVLVYGVSLHETVNLNCDVEALPSKVSFQWRFQGTQDLASFNQINDTSSILTYAPHAPQEFGSVECSGKNDVGLQQKSCRFQIIPAGPPTFPYNCQVMNQSDTSLVILCTFDVELSSNTSWSSAHLFPRKWSDQTRLLIHPRTHYICEVYHLTASHLVANVSTTISLSMPRHEDSNSFQFFVPGLPAATTLRLKIFAQNSKGRSDYSWLKAATLRPAERLIDSQSTSSGSSGSSGSSLFEENSNMLKGKPMLVLLSAAAILLILIVIVVGIIAFVKMNRTHGGSSSTFSESNSSHLHSSGGSHLQSNGQENDHLPSGDDHNNHFGSGSSNGPQSTFYKDELNDTNYCCEDDCCDQMLLTGGGSNDLRSYQPSSDYHQPSSSSKGPPDIIPSFGGYVLDPNCTATSLCGGSVNQFGVMDHHLHDKIPPNHFITYEPVIPYTENLTVDVVDPSLQYAEISFATSSQQSSSSCQTIPTPQILHSGSRISFIANDQQQQHKVTPPIRGPQSNSEYARIEFTKSSRVSVLGGSPKFESTV